MEIKTTSTNRKDMVKSIAEFLGEQSVYMGPPTFAYQIGAFTVDRNGTIMTEDSEKGETVREMLKENGFITEEGTEATSIKIPLEGMTPQGITNLMNLLYSKQYLLNKAVGTENFMINDALIMALENTESATAEEMVSFITGFEGYGRGFSFADGCILFTGFPFTEDGTKVKAYCELAASMVKAAKEQKRIQPKETIEENEKYYMRTWLVRLGFGGKEGKETRRVLLEKLKGHTAFRTEADKEKWNERQKAKKSQSPESGVE